MPFNMRLPNGHLVENIPDGVTKDEIAQRAISKGWATEDDFPDLFGESSLLGTAGDALMQANEVRKGVGRGFVNTFLTAGEGLVELADAGTNLVGLDDAIDSGAENPIINTLRGARERVNAALPADPRYQDRWLTKFGEGVGSMAGFLGPQGAIKLLGLTGKGVSLFTGFGMGAGVGSGEQAQRVQAARDAGIDVSQGEEDAAAFTGSLIGLTEFLPVQRILGGLKAKDIFDEFGNLKPLGQTIMARLSSAAKSGGAEGLQEASAGIMQDLTERGIYNPDATVADNALDELTVGGAVGALADFTLNAMTGRRKTALSAEAREIEAAVRREEAEEMRRIATQEFSSPALAEEGTAGLLPPPPGLDPEDMRGSARQAARQMADQRGENFPMDTVFTSLNEAGDPTNVVLDGNGSPVSPEFQTQEEAAIFAGALNEVAFDRNLQEQARIAVEQAAGTYNARERTGLRLFMRRLFHPDSNDLTYNQINAAAGTVVENGYAHERMSLDEAQAAGIPLKDMTAVQRANYYRRKAGRPETDTFSIEEARKVLKDDMSYVPQFQFANVGPNETFRVDKDGDKWAVNSSLGLKVKSRRKTFDELEMEGDQNERTSFKSKKDAQNYAKFLTQRAKEGAVMRSDLGAVEDITVDDIKGLLKAKNYTSDINSPEVRAIAEVATGLKARGKTKPADMSQADLALTYHKLRSLPDMSQPQPLPDYSPRPYTPQQYQVARRAARDLIASRETLPEQGALPSREDIAAASGKPISKAAYGRLKKDILADQQIQREAESLQRDRELNERAEAAAGRKREERQSAQRKEQERQQKLVERAVRRMMSGFGLDRVGTTIIERARQARLNERGEVELGPETGNPSYGAFKRSMNEIFLMLENLKQRPAYKKALEEGATQEALDAILVNEALETLNHEALHAMRQADLFTPDEWNVLRRVAATRKVPGQDYTYLEYAANVYADQSADQRVEEAVAEVVRDGLAGRLKVGGRAKSLMRRVLEFLKGIVGLKGETQFTYFDDLMDAIRTGEIGSRDANTIRTTRAVDRAQSKAQHKAAMDKAQEKVRAARSAPEEEKEDATPDESGAASAPTSRVVGNQSVPDWVEQRPPVNPREAFFSHRPLIALTDDIVTQVENSLTGRDKGIALRVLQPDGEIWFLDDTGEKLWSKYSARGFAELKRDIEVRGTQRPISMSVSKGGKLNVADGTHRLLAARELGMNTVPVSLTPNFADYGTPESLPSLRYGDRNSSDEAEQRAFHGAGKKFKRFDPAFIHSGLGLQAFGLGFYFSENKGVATEYAAVHRFDNETGMLLDGNVVPGPARAQVPGLEVATKWLEFADMNKVEAFDLMNTAYQYLVKELESDPYNKDLERTVKKYDAAYELWPRISTQRGFLYEVDIDDAAIDTMLIWEKTKEQQPLEVQAAWLAAENQNLIDSYDIDTGAEFFDALEMSIGPEEAVAHMMRYGSRGSTHEAEYQDNEGPLQRNIVVYDPSDITITSVNGVAREDMFEDDMAERRMFHGSPHLFDKFKTDSIGTGTGVQVEGHGLYFASNQNLAKGYGRRLSDGIEGNLYEVEVDDSAIENMLRLDEGVLYQDHVMEKLRAAAVRGDQIAARALEGIELMKNQTSARQTDGYRLIDEILPKAIGGLMRPQDRSKEVSKFLLSLGIRGNIYGVKKPDGRGFIGPLVDVIRGKDGEEIAANMVLFDESDVRVTARNGQPVQTYDDIAEQRSGEGVKIKASVPEVTDPRSKFLMPMGDVENELYELLERTGYNPTRGQLARIDGAPKPPKQDDGKRRRTAIYQDMKPRPLSEVRKGAQKYISSRAYRKWYQQFSEGLGGLVGPANLPEAAAVFGITSAQNPAEMNLVDTLSVMMLARRIDPVEQRDEFTKAVANYKRPSTGNKLFITGGQIERIADMYAKGHAEGGLKITSLMQNMNDIFMSYFSPRSVQDVHMARVWGFIRKKWKTGEDGKRRLVDDTKSLDAKPFRYGQFMTRVLANEFGLQPHEMRAVLWFYGKRDLAPKKSKAGTWASAQREAQPEIRDLQAMIESGSFDMDNGLTQALRESDTRASNKITQTKTAAYSNYFQNEDVQRVARERASAVAVATKPGNARGYGFPAGTPFQALRAYNEAMLKRITDEDGKIPFLRRFGIPHEVALGEGSYEGREPNIIVRFPGGTLDQAAFAANILGNALLQDAAITVQPDVEGEFYGVAVTKKDGSEFTQEDLEQVAKAANPDNDRYGNNYTLVAPGTLVFLDGSQFNEAGGRRSDYDVVEDHAAFYNEITNRLPNDLEIGTFQQNGDYYDAEGYQSKAKSLGRKIRENLTPRVQERADRTLFQPAWELYEATRENLGLGPPENQNRPSLTGAPRDESDLAEARRLEGMPETFTVDVRAARVGGTRRRYGAKTEISIPVNTSKMRKHSPEAVDRAVQEVKEIEETTKLGVPRISTKASPEAQYVAQDPSRAMADDTAYQRRPVDLSGDPTFEAAVNRAAVPPPAGRHPMDIYNIDSELKPSRLQFFLTKMRQAVLNKYDRLEKLNWSTGLRENLADSSSIAAALHADRAMGIAGSAIKDGVPVYRDGWVYVLNKELAETLQKKNPNLDFSDIDLDNIKSMVQVNAPLFDNPYGDLTQVAQAYAVAQRSYRLDKEGKKVPVSDQEIADIERGIRQYTDTSTGENIIRRWWDDWQRYNGHVIQLMKDAGILTDETAQIWRDNADYFPFYRIAEGADAKQFRLGQPIFGGMTGAIQLKRLKGKEEAVNMDMMEAMSLNLTAAIQMSMKNIAQQRIVRDMRQIGLAEMLRPGETADAPVVEFRAGGQKLRAAIYDPLIYESMQALESTDTVGMVQRTFGLPATWLRELVTRDPGFMMVNLMRDSLSSYVTSGARLTPFLSTMKGLTGGISTLEQLGAVGGYDYKNDPDNVVDYHMKQLAKAGAIDQSALKLFSRVWEGLGNWTTRSDAATRNAVFNDVYARTGNYAEAAFQAMEVINFGRRGGHPLARMLGAVVPFLNARLQGLDVFWRALNGRYTADKKKNTRQIMASALTRGALLSGATALYYLLVGDDDQYKDAPDFVKDNNWIIPTDMGVPVTIPIPFEVGLLFKTIPEMALARFLSGDDSMFTEGAKYDVRTKSEVAGGLGRGIGSTLEISPFQIQFLGPLMEVMTNYDSFTGRQVVPQYLIDGREPGLQSRAYTNELARMLGEKFNLSPMQIEHVMSGYSGTIGQYVMDLVDIGLRSEAVRGDDAIPMPTRPYYDYPMIKRLLGKQNDTGLVEDAYEMHRLLKKTKQSFDMLQKEGRFDEAVAYVKDRETLLAMERGMRPVKDELDKVRKYRDNIMRSSMSSEEKRRRLDQLDAYVNQYLRAIMPQVEEMANEPYLQPLYR